MSLISMQDDEFRGVGVLGRPGPCANIDSSVLRTLPLGCCANRDVPCPLLISSRSCSEHYRSRCTALALGWSATAPPLPSCPNSPAFQAGLSIDVFAAEFRSKPPPTRRSLGSFRPRFERRDEMGRRGPGSGPRLCLRADERRPQKGHMRAVGCIAQRSRNPGKRYPMWLRMPASLTASASVP
jgi:hypothetical protein